MEKTPNELGLGQLKEAYGKLQRILEEIKNENDILRFENYSLRQKAAIDSKRLEEIRANATNINRVTVSLQKGISEILSSSSLSNKSTESPIVPTANISKPVTGTVSTTDPEPFLAPLPMPNATSTPKSVSASSSASAPKILGNAVPKPANNLVSTTSQKTFLAPMPKATSTPKFTLTSKPAPALPPTRPSTFGNIPSENVVEKSGLTPTTMSVGALTPKTISTASAAQKPETLLTQSAQPTAMAAPTAQPNNRPPLKHITIKPSQTLVLVDNGECIF